MRVNDKDQEEKKKEEESRKKKWTRRQQERISTDTERQGHTLMLLKKRLIRETMPEIDHQLLPRAYRKTEGEKNKETRKEKRGKRKNG